MCVCMLSVCNKMQCFGFVPMKEKFVPGEQSTKCSRQVCKKGRTDRFWDEILSFLIMVTFYVSLFSNIASSAFHNVLFSLLGNKTDKDAQRLLH